MKLIDRLIRQWRFSQAKKYAQGDCLDLGSHDGSWLASLPKGNHLGIERNPPGQSFWPAVQSDFTTHRKFQTITCLATYEHLSDCDRELFWEMVNNSLEMHGRLILTIPVPLVDLILSAFIFLRIADGIGHEEHRNVSTHEVFDQASKQGLKETSFYHFMFGLNRFFVFEKV